MIKLKNYNIKPGPLSTNIKSKVILINPLDIFDWAYQNIYFPYNPKIKYASNKIRRESFDGTIRNFSGDIIND